MPQMLEMLPKTAVLICRILIKQRLPLGQIIP
jgi:hypothetical protein